MKPFTLALALLLVVPMLPGVAADPLPVPIPDPPIPEDPSDGGAPVKEIQKILEELFPSDAPFEKNCIEDDSSSHDNYDGPPLEIDSDDSGVTVKIYLDGMRYKIKIQSDCITG